MGAGRKAEGNVGQDDGGEGDQPGRHGWQVKVCPNGAAQFLFHEEQMLSHNKSFP